MIITSETRTWLSIKKTVITLVPDVHTWNGAHSSNVGYKLDSAVAEMLREQIIPIHSVQSDPLLSKLSKLCPPQSTPWLGLINRCHEEHTGNTFCNIHVLSNCRKGRRSSYKQLTPHKAPKMFKCQNYPPNKI